jgi:hypothetical protein
MVVPVDKTPYYTPAWWGKWNQRRIRQWLAADYVARVIIWTYEKSELYPLGRVMVVTLIIVIVGGVKHDD